MSLSVLRPMLNPVGQEAPVSSLFKRLLPMFLGLVFALSGAGWGEITGTSISAQAQSTHFSGKIRHLPKYRTNHRKASHKRHGYKRHHRVRKGRIYHRSTNYKHYLPGSRKTYRRHYNPRRHYNRHYRNYKYHGPQRRIHRKYHRRYNSLNGHIFYFKGSDYNNRSNYRRSHRDYRSHYRGQTKIIKRVISSAVIADDQKRRNKGEVVNEHPTDPSTVYYDEKRCKEGYDCVMRLGDSPSSPKIIVLGEKRQPGSADDKAPKVVYPPIN